MHLTGEFAIQGQAFREGLELGAEAVRSESGMQMELQFEDTRYLGVQALSGAKHLLLSNSISAAVISTATEVKSAGPELQRAGVPTIVLWDASPDIERIGDRIFSIGAWAPSSGEVTADFAKNGLNAKSAAIIQTNTEWSEQVSRAFQARFERGGGVVVAAENLNPDETDFRTAMLRVKRKLPDVVYAPADSNLIAFFSQIKQLQIAAPILTSDVITEDNLAEDAAPFDGVYQSMPMLADSEQLRLLEQRYLARFGHPSTQKLFVAWGFDAARLIGFAAQRGSSRDAVSQSLKEVRDFPGVTNTINLNEGRSAAVPLTMFQIRGGEFHKTP